jgi:G3E family GTPase
MRAEDKTRPGEPCRRPDVVPATTPTLPVTIVTGFLGSGKTTMINHLMHASSSERLAVIVNEFGALGIDGPLLGDGPGRVVELSNGCMCCESRGNLVGALATLSSRAASIDAVVIETSGVADPFGVADVLVETRFTSEYVLGSVVTVIDADNFDANLNQATAAYRQMVCADLLVISKADLVPTGTVEAISNRISGINPHAAVVVADRGRLPIQFGLADLEKVHRTQVPSPVGTRHDLVSFSWQSPRPIDANGFTAWVDGLPSTVKRLKAIVVTADGAVSIQRVGVRTTTSTAPASAAKAMGGAAVRLVLFAPAIDDQQLIEQLHLLQEDMS